MANRLARESSPYLRQHADNPVDWYPWGEEALALARSSNRPILLSVGYSACHWCHVMAHESFEDGATAAVMNRLFVNIKVDREERPDVDQLYQGVVQLMGRGGGWPLTVFLTPDLKPFYGGTYFPKEDRYGMPAFTKVLTMLADAYAQRPKDVAAQAAQFVEGLGELARYGLSPGQASPGAQDVADAGKAICGAVDEENGGFGGAPKFPNPMNVALLLRAWRRGAGEEPKRLALLTLEKMAHGGIYDQLGGGFHRYSVDAHWRVPHFEKMLYDNAQLLHLYAEAQQVEPRALWRKVAEETVAYLAREMTAPGGGFYATQDADSEHEEGKFFVWTPHEVDAVLDAASATLVKAHFGLTERGNFEHGKSVLEVKQTVTALARESGRDEAEVAGQLARARQALFDARERRTKPGRDDKVLAGWNGLMIRGLAHAARAFGRPEWATLARGAADFVLREQWDGQRLLRVYQDGVAKIDAFIEDYGGLAAGLVALYQVGFEEKYLKAAEALTRAAVDRFWDAETGAYRTAAKGQTDLLLSPFALHDNAVPSGASSLTEAQVALAGLTNDITLLEQARRYVARAAGELKRNPLGVGHLWLAVDALADGALEVTVEGPSPEAEAWFQQLWSGYHPTAVWLRRESTGPVRGLICREGTCGLPLTRAADVAVALGPPPA
jgi:uncharacterized protein YyaL (SSP411 family)